MKTRRIRAVIDFVFPEPEETTTLGTKILAAFCHPFPIGTATVVVASTELPTVEPRYRPN